MKKTTKNEADKAKTLNRLADIFILNAGGTVVQTENVTNISQIEKDHSFIIGQSVIGNPWVKVKSSNRKEAELRHKQAVDTMKSFALWSRVHELPEEK